MIIHYGNVIISIIMSTLTFQNLHMKLWSEWNLWLEYSNNTGWPFYSDITKAPESELA